MKSQLINFIPKEYHDFIKMYLNIYKEDDIGDLHRIPNLFVLYNKSDKTISYNGKNFKI